MKAVHFVVLSLVAAVGAAVAADKILVSVDANRVAISGYDAVGFFKSAKPIKGDPSINAIYDGAVYFFDSEEHREIFLKDPESYAPQFGGYCPVALHDDTLMAGDPNNFRVEDGKLYLVCDEMSAKRFDAYMDEIKAEAEKKWYEKIEVYGTPYTYGVTRQD